MSKWCSPLAICLVVFFFMLNISEEFRFKQPYCSYNINWSFKRKILIHLALLHFFFLNFKQVKQVKNTKHYIMFGYKESDLAIKVTNGPSWLVESRAVPHKMTKLLCNSTFRHGSMQKQTNKQTHMLLKTQSMLLKCKQKEVNTH